MSSAIAIRGSRLAWDFDYEPVTDSSRDMWRNWVRKRNYLQGSALDWLPTTEAALHTIKKECSRANWDGSGAIPVSDYVINLAAEIIEALFTILPRGIPAPDLIPEADGEICLSWSVDASRIFSLSLGAHGNINFAGQFGTMGGVHGWQPIDPATPSTLEESLADVVRYVSRLREPATVRSAA